MTFEGIIATPFGYLIDGLYQLTGNYGLTLMLFAICVQLVMFPISLINRKNDEKKAKIRPIIAQIKAQYKDNPDKQADEMTAVYNREKISLAGSFVLKFLPFFIVVPIFQVIAQPIRYMFHESPETVSLILATMRQEAPELFTSGYHQIIAISHIQDYAYIVEAAVPQVATRTLLGLDYTLFGIDINTVLGSYILGNTPWTWEISTIFTVTIPIIYMARRIYGTFRGIYIKFSTYAKQKKEAKANGFPVPTLPAPPIIPLVFLFLSFTAMASIPIAMNIYWLVSGLVAGTLQKIHTKLHKA